MSQHRTRPDTGGVIMQVPVESETVFGGIVETENFCFISRPICQPWPISRLFIIVTVVGDDPHPASHLD